ncbi:hypothetical protein Glove_217g49 [Diversispora epigaea]|uniref:Uncharacterized protein n=1 Tax=Diversispora epigaea TaxID=1348612 RepID=A0A397IGN2_9GLOM|nr:hypothetical protein Glove_217g49 [Diversispora epigaea]
MKQDTVKYTKNGNNGTMLLSLGNQLVTVLTNLQNTSNIEQCLNPYYEDSTDKYFEQPIGIVFDSLTYSI